MAVILIHELSLYVLIPKNYLYILVKLVAKDLVEIMCVLPFIPSLAKSASQVMGVAIQAENDLSHARFHCDAPCLMPM